MQYSLINRVTPRRPMVAAVLALAMIVTGGTVELRAQPLGIVDTVGTTYISRQHSGEVGRTIALDASGFVHVCWMNAMDDNVPPAERHISYSVRSPEGEWVIPGGCRVDIGSRAGYGNLALRPENRAMIAYHGNGGMQAHAQVCVDYLPRVCEFDCYEFPGQPYMMIEPHIAGDLNGRVHAVFEDMTTESDSFGVWYSSAIYDTITAQFEGTDAVRVGWQLLASHNVACSRRSLRVAIAWSDLRPDYEGNYHQYNNDIFLMISEDGGTTWGDVINVTSFLAPDLTALPDTLLADQDTLRSFNDCALLFDEEDNLHIAFTTIGYWAIEGVTTDKASMIWHWSEATEVFSPLAEGWEEFDGSLPAGLDHMVQQPSLGIDTTTGFLYCTYMHSNPADVSPGNLVAADIWATVSTDGGMAWAEGLNLSWTVGDSHTTAHECDASLAEIVDGNLRIFFQGDIDLDGARPSLNPVLYQEVPVAEIPTTPLIPWRPLHVDYSSAPPAPSGTPVAFRLLPNYPNPFNAVTVIPFELRSPRKVSLIIYDILGREVARLIDGEDYTVGTHRVSWSATSQASGLFFAHLKVDGKQAVRRLVLLK
jgi:hypothetical protein